MRPPEAAGVMILWGGHDSVSSSEAQSQTMLILFTDGGSWLDCMNALNPLGRGQSAGKPASAPKEFKAVQATATTPNDTGEVRPSDQFRSGANAAKLDLITMSFAIQGL